MIPIKKAVKVWNTSINIPVIVITYPKRASDIDLRDLFKQCHTLIRLSKPVFVLQDFSKGTFIKEQVPIFKEFALENKPFVVRSATVIPVALQEILYPLIAQLGESVNRAFFITPFPEEAWHFLLLPLEGKEIKLKGLAHL
jgi:hypothetical protein